MTVTAGTPAAFRRQQPAYDWNDLASVIALTGDANHNHIPGSPMEWRHTYIPVSEAAARSHGHGKVPKGWKAPSGGGKGTSKAVPKATRAPAAAVAKSGRTPEQQALHGLAAKAGLKVNELRFGDGTSTHLLDRNGAVLSHDTAHPGQVILPTGQRIPAGEAPAYLAAYKATPDSSPDALLDTARGTRGGVKISAASKIIEAGDKGAAARGLSDEELGQANRQLAQAAEKFGHPGFQTPGHKAVLAEIASRGDAGKAPEPQAAPKPGAASRPNTIVQPDPVTGNLREVSQKETAEAAGRYATTLRAGSAERGEVERQAMDIARGGPTWQRMKEDSDTLRPLVGKPGGGPKPDKELSYFEVQNAYQAAHGRQAPKSMLRSWAFNGPSSQDKRSAWYRDGVTRKNQMQAQASLRARLITARPDAAKEDAAQANARADIKAVQQSGQRAAAARAAAKPKAPKTPQPSAPRKSAADKLGLISERMTSGDKTSGTMQAGDMLQGHQAVSQAPVGIIGGTSDPWWMAGPGGKTALSVLTNSGKRQLIPWSAEKQQKNEAAAMKATRQRGDYVSGGSNYQQALARTVAARQKTAAGLAWSWDDLAPFIDLAARTPVKTAAAKAARPPGKPATVPPVPPPAAVRRSKITPLTPMRVQAAKSMTKLADSMKETHPEMLTHQHVRDAARMLRAGNEEAAQRHLRAAMFSLTPQSLMRHGLHTDDAHTAARGHMHGAHRALLLVKDITDVAAKNQAAVAKASYGDNLSAPPHPDPNNGFGPGALAQKPTVRQPPGNQALNAPAGQPGGGSDPAVADPDSPQKPGSKQFSYGWDDLGTLVELSAETGRLAVTPAPRGKPGGPGLYDVKGQEHTPYFQNLVKTLIEKRGMDPGKAYAIAYGALRKWAKGGGKVHGEVRAAAAGALAGEAAKAHGHAVTWDDVALTARHVIELAAGQTRVPAGQPGGGQWAAAQQQQAVAGHQAGATASQKHMAHIAHLRHLVAIGTATPAQRAELAGLMKTLGPAVKAPAAAKAPAKAKAAKVPAAPKAAAKPKAAPKPKAAAKAPAAPKAAAKAPAATAAAPATASGSSSGSGSGSPATPASSSAGTPAAAPSATGTPPAASSATAPSTTTGTPPAGTPAATTAAAATGTPAAASTPAATPAEAAGAPAATTGTPATVPATPATAAQAPATPAAAIAAAVQQAKTGTPPAGRPAAAPMSAAPVFSKNGTVTVTVGGKPMTMSAQQWKQLRRAQLQAAGPNVRH